MSKTYPHFQEIKVLATSENTQSSTRFGGTKHARPTLVKVSDPENAGIGSENMATIFPQLDALHVLDTSAHFDAGWR